MRWGNRQQSKHLKRLGSFNEFDTFLILPHTINGETRWLETARIRRSLPDSYTFGGARYVYKGGEEQWVDE